MVDNGTSGPIYMGLVGDRHAGFSYSGPAAAWAYAAIPTNNM
jgi:predicted class III extradiol MEMO1 family dioxygenase